MAIDVAAAGYLPEGTPLERRERGGQVTAQFETGGTVFVDPNWNAGLAEDATGGLRPAAWPGAADAILPRGSTGFLLLGASSGLLPGQRIALIQGARVHVATLTAVRTRQEAGWATGPEAAPGTDPVAVTEVLWDRPTDTPFSPWADPVAQPFLVTANLVTARHGETRLASNASLSRGRQDACFATDPATGATLLRALRTPEGDVLEDAAAGRPSVDVSIDGQGWSWQPSLLGSAGFDRHFTTAREQDGSVWLIFGDGLRGAAVTTDADLRGVTLDLRYRRGDPATGNIGAFALNTPGRFPSGDQRQQDLDTLGAGATTNILPAQGGRRAVSLAVARALVPESIWHPALERCVTPDDYARAARAVPGVRQATAKPLGGPFNTLAVLITPEAGDTLDPQLAEDVRHAIERRRMAGREIVVREPDYVPLDVGVLLCPVAGADPGALRAQARNALVAGAGGRGFFDTAHIGFGAEIRLTDVLAALQAEPAVGAVRALAFRPLFDAGAVAVHRAIRLGPTEIARFAGDESRPDRGRLTIRIEGVDAPVGATQGFRVDGPAPEPAGGHP